MLGKHHVERRHGAGREPVALAGGAHHFDAERAGEAGVEPPQFHALEVHGLGRHDDHR